MLCSSHLPDWEVSGAYLCLEFMARQDPSLRVLPFLSTLISTCMGVPPLWAVWMPEEVELKLSCIPDYSTLLHSLDTIKEFRWLKGKLGRIKGLQSKKWWQIDLLNWLAEVVFKYTFLKNKHVSVRPEGTLILMADLSIFCHLRPFGFVEMGLTLCLNYWTWLPWASFGSLTLDFTKRPQQLLDFAWEMILDEFYVGCENA